MLKPLRLSYFAFEDKENLMNGNTGNNLQLEGEKVGLGGKNGLYVKGVPFVNRRYTKGVSFLSKLVISGRKFNFGGLSTPTPPPGGAILL